MVGTFVVKTRLRSETNNGTLRYSTSFFLKIPQPSLGYARGLFIPKQTKDCLRAISQGFLLPNFKKNLI